MTRSRAPLGIWLYDTKVADLHDQGDGIGMIWTERAYERWGQSARVVSHILPISTPDDPPNPGRVGAFLEGLLPEGNARTNYAIDVGIRPDDVFGLIRRYGRDTAGALVFLSQDEPSPVRIGAYVPIDEAEVARRLLAADSNSPTDQSQRGVESISLAGMQPKIGLHRTAAGWMACQNGAPSTHIVKLAHPDDSHAADVVDTEAASLDLARRVGLTSVEAAVYDFTGVRAIAVSRYDRHISVDGYVSRIHQEDMAQALGINTADPERKFQRGRRLPALQAMADVLRAGGQEPDALLRLTTFNLLVGNTDAHAKNYSIVRLQDGSASLAPAYDISMHLHHQRRNPMFALDINGKFAMADISMGDVVAEGISWGLPAARADQAVAETINATSYALDHLEVDRHPRVSERAFEVVRDRIQSALQELPTEPSESATWSRAERGETPAAPSRRGPRRR